MTNMNHIPILICDDHAFMRVGLKSMIDMEPDMTVVGEASNGIAAVELARSLSPAVVIMDLMMPELNGVEASRRILAERPDTKIIVITSFGTSNLVNEALDLGVAGVHLKESPTDGLIDAIHKVMSGCQAIDIVQHWDGVSDIHHGTDCQRESCVDSPTTTLPSSSAFPKAESRSTSASSSRKSAPPTARRPSQSPCESSY